MGHMVKDSLSGYVIMVAGEEDRKLTRLAGSAGWGDRQRLTLR